MVLSVAIEEAYAVADVSGDLLDTLEFDHPTFAEPLRFVRGSRIKGEYETVVLPVPGNAAAPFMVVAFSFTRPGQEEGGTTKAKIRIDNVSQLLQGVLREAIASDQAFSVVYRCYSTLDKNNPEIYSGLRMGSVSISALSAEGDLYYEEVEMKAFPGMTYNLDDYPALYGQ
jgi:hypothetical protein